MDIKRIDSYADERFPQQALWQHGAFEAGGEAVWFEIVSEYEAVVHGRGCPQLIEEFRFFAEHITVFYDENGAMLAQFPRVETFPVKISDIQPSQFYVDEEKLEAVRKIYREAQWYFDFCYVGNSEGAHNTELATYCLDKSEELINEGMKLLNEQ